MAHIQLVGDPGLLKYKPWLFHKGTRLFVKGDSGVEKLHLAVDRKVTLELAGTNPTPVGIHSTDHKNFTLSPVNALRQFTIKATGAWNTILTGTDAAGKSVTSAVLVTAGPIEKHPGMEIDLVSDILGGADAVRIHALHRFLNDNHDNIFNENWQPIIDKRGMRACGTVAKDGGQALWGVDADAHNWKTYHIPFDVVRGASSYRLTDRKDVKFKDATLKQGRTAISTWLSSKKKPVVIGVLYGPTAARPYLLTNRYGQIERTLLSGHTVLIVGCDKAAESFLYIDPWHGGSRLIYGGGLASDKFADYCSMGILKVDRSDSTRGPMLRQTTLTEGTFKTGGGSFLEAISGP